MRELPTGTVTFLFTDIEGSTRLLRIEGMNMERVKRFPYEAVDALSPAAE